MHLAHQHDAKFCTIMARSAEYMTKLIQFYEQKSLRHTEREIQLLERRIQCLGTMIDCERKRVGFRIWFDCTKLQSAHESKCNPDSLNHDVDRLCTG